MLYDKMNKLTPHEKLLIQSLLNFLILLTL